jgi:TRAP transporter TAXI family solute receptor
MRRLLLIGLAAGLAGLAAGLLAIQWVSMPTTLRVAVGPMTSEDTRLLAAVTQHLARERHPVRLKLVLTEGVAASAAVIDEGRAELAVVRTDVAMPTRAQTVAVLHRDAAVILALEGGEIAKVGDLKGRTVGLVRDMPANLRLLETVLAHYEVPQDEVATQVLAGPAEAEEALRSRRVDAVMAVGPLTGRTLAETVAAALRAGAGAPAFVPVGEAEAIAQRSPALESVEVVRGAFGGTPPRPAETMTTLGVSHRLVARADLDEGLVSELTRLLFALRPAVSAEVPLANRIEAPDTSKSSSLPVHPGAGAYYEGEVLTFMERYGDWFYLAVMVLSIAGSALAGVASTAANRSRARDVALLDELLTLVLRARQARSLTELDALEQEADGVLGAALAKAGSGGLDGSGIAAFSLGLDEARRAIEDRRAALKGGAPVLSQAAE